MLKKTLNHALISASILSLFLPVQSYAGITSANNQATATVAAECTISAQNLSFGNLVLPLSAQSASTSMTVLCSKSHTYSVGLAYGGIYGQGGSAGSNYIQSAGDCYGSACPKNINNVTPTGAAEIWNVYNPSGQLISSLSSVVNNPPVSVWEADWGVTLTESNGIYYEGAVASPSYAYGKMLGVAHGDNIAYAIQVPNNPGQVWNAGENNYSSTGTGVSQTIPVVGTLIPAQSGSNYPTPDSYMDSVTAVVSF